MSKEVRFRQLAKELVTLEVKDTDTIKQLWNKFYNLMRRYGIKEGEKIKGGGRQCDAFEWTLCCDYFWARVSQGTQWKRLFNGTPKDLLK